MSPASAASSENHMVSRIGWLRAAVLGANDGIISTASLLVGVASASNSPAEIFTAGIAGMFAGAMSMAAGEYVSVSSQADTESADLAKERKELEEEWDFEVDELAEIYEKRGLDPQLARQVALELMAKDALGAHARDELGITEMTAPKPVQAALTSAGSFAVGAILPLLVALLAPIEHIVPFVFSSVLVFLALLGTLGARAGGSKSLMPTLRVAFWGALAMTVTAGVGALVGKSL